MKTKSFYFLAFALLMMNTTWVKAHWEPRISSKVTVADQTLDISASASGTPIALSDWLFADLNDLANSGTGNPALMQLVDQDVVNILEAGFGESQSYTHPEYCEIEFRLRIYGYHLLGGAPDVIDIEFSDSFKIKFDPQSGFMDYPKVARNIPGDYLKLECHVLEVNYRTITSGSLGNQNITDINDLPENLYVGLSMEVDRVYDFGYEDPGNPSINFASVTAGTAIQFTPLDDLTNASSITLVSATACDGYYELSWPSIVSQGFDNYEVEWTFIEESLVTGTSPNLSFTAGFNKNSTRVQVKGNTYRIPAIYPQGFVVARVRGVTDDFYYKNTNLYKTDWSLPDEAQIGYNTATQEFTLTYTATVIFSAAECQGYAEAFNWDHSVSFAEEGKRKQAISYYDGSLRNRQTATVLSTENVPVVGEVIYDYLGRPVVQPLPVPVLDEEGLCFRALLNVSTATDEPYSWKDFDPDYQQCGPTQTGSMSTSNGASAYYSSDGSTLINTTFSDYEISNNQKQAAAFIPDAQGYPFTQVEYLPDGTGRVSRQGGVGITHQLNGVDENTDPLPGKEISYHYGNAPQTELLRLFGNEIGQYAKYQKNYVTDQNGQRSVSYVDPNGNVVATCLVGDPEAVINVGHLSSSEGENVLIPENLDNTEIRLEEGELIAVFEHVAGVDGNYQFTYTMTSPQLSGFCDNELCFDCIYDFELSIKDECGTELIPGGPKTATVGTVDYECGMEAIGFSMTPSPLVIYVTKGTTLHIEKKLKINESAYRQYEAKFLETIDDCIPSYEELYTEERAKLSDDCEYDPCEDCEGDAATRLANGDISQNEYDYTVFQCKEVCNPTPCTILMRNMIQDMSPGGQYFDNLTAYEPGVTNPDDQTRNYDWMDQTLTQQQYNDFFSEVNLENGTSYTSWEEIRYNFEDQFAFKLVQYHPEYCYYQSCIAIEETYVFDMEMLASENATEALVNGYFNPIGSNPNTTEFPAPTVKDPFFVNSSGNPVGYYYEMREALLNFDNSTWTSLWQILQDYRTNSTLGNTTGNSNCPSSFDFQLFYAGYQTWKVEQLARYYDSVCQNTEIVEGKARRFTYDHDEVLTENPLYNPDRDLMKENIEEEMASTCGERCEGYALSWMQSLAPCGLSPTHADMLKQELIEICSNSCDDLNPVGSSRSNVPTLNNNRSFEEALDWIINLGGYSYSAGCNPDVIAMPTNELLPSPSIWTKPLDGCACEHIIENATEYQTKLNNSTLPAGICSESDYFTYKFGFSINLDLAKCMCAEMANPGNLPSECENYSAVFNPLARKRQEKQLIREFELFINTMIADPGITWYNSPTPNGYDLLTMFPDYFDEQWGFYDKTQYPCSTLKYEASVSQFNLPPYGLVDQLNITISNSCYNVCTMTIDFTDPGSAFPFSDIDELQFTSYELVGGVLHVTVINPNNQQEVDLSISGCLLSTTLDPGYPDIGIPHTMGCISCVTCVEIEQYWASFESKYSGVAFSKDEYEHVRVFQNYIKNNEGLNLPIQDLQALLLNCAHQENCPPTPVSHLLVELFQTLLDNGDINNSSTSLDNPTYGPAYAALFDFNFEGCNPRIERTASTEFQLIDDCGTYCELVLSNPLTGGMVLEASQSYALPGMDNVLQVATDAGFSNFITITSDCYVFADCEQDPTLQICPPEELEPVDPCVKINDEIASANAYRRYQNLKEAALRDFKQRYYSKCMEAFEEFRMEYNLKEYHYTLYYYDQAGNLIKTVPPAGVHPVTDPADLAQARNYLNNQTGQRIMPQHTLITNYKYNTINQLVEQGTPDGGVSRFWYDYLGRLVISQNAKQNQSQLYSYTEYDELGRVVESGEITLPNGISPSESADPVFLASLLDNNKTSKTEIVRTYYDEPLLASGQITGFTQFNLRNRVSSTTRQENYSADPLVYDAATHYTYDIHGNVNKLITERPAMETYGQRYKTLEYRYDLISGNTHLVMYQPGELDQRYHYYRYDADNRLTSVHTASSFDPDLLRGFTLPNLTENPYWTNDAEYEYYLHGPLMRTSYGMPVVQAMDYAYTLHGWLKAINSTALSPDKDMGLDGAATGPHTAFPRDVFAMELHYYSGDYQYVNGIGASDPIAVQSGSSHLKQNTYDLYNGNISQMHVSIPDPAQLEQGNFVNATLGKTYYYDQLNRILRSLNHDDFNLGLYTWGTSAGAVSEQYKTEYTYDANGNILTLFRNGVNGNLPMDELQYHYLPNSNKLEYVSEAQSDDYNYPDDIENQDPGNYDYDAIGNLIQDQSEEIESIEWNVMGKIRRINRTVSSSKSDLEFEYDESGRRIAKTEYIKALSGQVVRKTLYSLDASGNPMAIYTLNTWLESGVYYDTLCLGEHILYGTSRVGEEKTGRSLAYRQYELDNGLPVNESVTIHLLDGDVQNYSTEEKQYTLENERGYRGRKRYEISNHLGNVSAVVTDKKIAATSPGTPTVPDYFLADVYMLYDYYPFGAMLPERFYINNGCVRVAQPPVEIELEQDDFSARVDDPSETGTWTSSDPFAIHTSFNQGCQCFEINMYNNGANYVATEITPAIGTKNTVAVRFDPGNASRIIMQVVDPVTGKIWANRLFDFFGGGHEITAELEFTPDLSASSPLELRIYAQSTGYATMYVREVSWHDIGGSVFNTLLNEDYTFFTGAWTGDPGITIGNGPGMDVVNITGSFSGAAWNPVPVTPGQLHRMEFDLHLYGEPFLEIEVRDQATMQILYKQRVENVSGPEHKLDISFTPMGGMVDFRVLLPGATQPAGVDIDNFILSTPLNVKSTVYQEDFSSMTTGTWVAPLGVVLTYDPGSGGLKIQTGTDYDHSMDIATAASGGQEYYMSMEVYTDMNNATQLDVLDMSTLRPLSSRIIPVSSGHYRLTLSFSSQSGVFLRAMRMSAGGIASFRIDNIEVHDYQHFLSSQGGLGMNTTTDYSEWTATGGTADFKTYLVNGEYAMEFRNYSATYVSRMMSVLQNESTDLTFTLDRRASASGSVAVVVINPANNGTLASQMVSTAGQTAVSLNFVPPGTEVELRVYNPGEYTLLDDLHLSYDRIVYHTVCDNSSDYRFGFNGQEKDNEKAGLANALNFKARIYDSRIGNFLSTDPLEAEFASISPYSFVEGNPIQLLDPTGESPIDGVSLQGSIGGGIYIGGKRGFGGFLSVGIGLNYSPIPSLSLGANVSGQLRANTIGTHPSSKGIYAADLVSTLSTSFGSGSYSTIRESTYNSMNSDNILNSFKNSVTLAFNVAAITARVQGNVKNSQLHYSSSAALRFGDFYFMAQNDLLFHTDHAFGAEHNLRIGNFGLWSEIYNGQRFVGRQGRNTPPSPREHNPFRQPLVKQSPTQKAFNLGQTTFYYSMPDPTNTYNLTFMAGSQGGGDMWPQRMIHDILGYDQFLHKKNDFNFISGVKVSPSLYNSNK